MWKDQVQDAGQALVYLANCTLATIEDMAGKKSRLVGEFKRQIEIAKTTLDWIDQFSVPVKGTRVIEVRLAGGLDNWVEKQLKDMQK